MSIYTYNAYRLSQWSNCEGTRGNAIPLAYTTAVGGRGGMWRTPRPLHHQLKSKYGQFFARKPQVLLHFSDTTLLLRYQLIAVGITYRT